MEPQGRQDKSAMILCMNLNAAIDKTLIVPSFELNKIHRPKSAILLAGGKGVNVGRALKTLGEVPVVSDSLTSAKPSSRTDRAGEWSSTTGQKSMSF